MKYVIDSRRSYEFWPSWHLVYEWEDEIVRNLKKSRINSESKFNYLFRKLIFEKLKLLSTNVLVNQNKHVCFEMVPRLESSINNRGNLYPIIIDFFLKEEQLIQFEQAYNKNPIVFVTSKEVYDFLLKANVKLRIEHLPLSIPDKYRINEHTCFDKIYDFVLFGRVNKVLKEYLLKYSNKHPSVVFVAEGKEKFHYYTNKGDYVGFFKSRESYINLMKKSRIALYSTPGMDSSRTDTNGFNQVTPKFLEYIACGCHLVLRYPQNPDTKYYELDKFSPSVETFEQFSELVGRFIVSSPDMKFYSNYLEKHYTSQRVKLLKNILQGYEK